MGYPSSIAVVLLLRRTGGEQARCIICNAPADRSSSRSEGRRFVRLACLKHAASVHPEPGSNSQIKFLRIKSLNQLYQ
ncbi:hypothetical protein C4546_01200 [Candidatus Parcubacteria bacterium]|nr:MAG: hypothetical protein C4546_01200 [Candidatus Parcubacteria bacterium]